MKIRFQLYKFLRVAITLLCTFTLLSSPYTANAAPNKTNTQQKTSSKEKKRKSSTNRQKSKSKHSSSKKNKQSSIQFSKSEINDYKNKDYETWESPREISELGLPIEPGFAQPYPYSNLLRLFNGNRCRHRGIDIGTVGEKNNGLGSVVNAAATATITFIGKTGENTAEFGKLDKKRGTLKRTGRSYPRQILVPGYGLVYPFSTNYGRWRSGTVIVTRISQGPLKNHILRYMHLAAVRPDLKIGDTIHAGEHIGIMGGTAVLESWPHVHIDLETPQKVRIDIAPYIGLPDTSINCTVKKNSAKNVKKHSSSVKKHSTKKHSSSVKKRPRKSYIAPVKKSSKPTTRIIAR